MVVCEEASNKQTCVWIRFINKCIICCAIKIKIKHLIAQKIHIISPQHVTFWIECLYSTMGDIKFSFWYSCWYRLYSILIYILWRTASFSGGELKMFRLKQHFQFCSLMFDQLFLPKHLHVSIILVILRISTVNHVTWCSSLQLWFYLLFN